MASRLSVTQILTYLRCPLQYRYRYVDRAAAPQGAAAARGKAVHRAVEANYRHKLETGRDLPPEAVEREAAAAFDAEAPRVAWAEGEDPAEFRRQAVELAALYRREVAPSVIPALVEARVEIPLDGAGCALVGFIDLVDAEGVIRDTKTASRAPARDEAERSLQLTAYALAHRRLTGRREAGLRLDCLVLGASGAKAVSLEAPPRPDWEVERFLRTAAGVARAIRAGLFYPNPQGDLCSERWCPYWGLCRGEF